MRAALVVLVLVAGCAKQGTDLPTWTLATGGTTVEVTLPGSLRAERTSDELAYTLSTEVPLRPDQRGRALAFVLDCFHAPIALTVDGEPLATTSEAADGAWHFAVPARLTEDARLAVVMAVPATSAASLGFGVVPRLTDDPHGDPRWRGVVAFNRYSAIVALCFLGLLAVLYTMLASIERGRPEYLSFIAYSLTACGTPLLQLGVFHAVLGDFGTQVFPIVITAASLSGIYFIHHALQLGPVHRAWPITLGAYAVLTPFSAFSTSAISAVSAALLLVIAAADAYGIVRLLPLTRRSVHAGDARLMLVPYLAIAILLVPTMLYAVTGRSGMAGLHPMSVVVAAQAAAQALILARHHVARQRTLEITNAALQRQVAERSRELGDALRSLAAPNGAAPATSPIAVHLDRLRDHEQARPLLAQIAAQLAALHGKGIVHGDLELSALQFDGDDVKIAGGDEAHTVAAKGTPRASATTADDILAFGRLAHELVTGEPTAASTDAELATLPSPLGVIIARCFDPDPDRRPTAAELAEALA